MAIALGVMIFAIVTSHDWLPRFVNVPTGVLLTGADILLGFLIGTGVRRMPFESRRACAIGMLPKTLFIMPTLGIIAPTSGWCLAVHLGYLDIGFPEFWWVIAALTVAAIVGVQGLFIILSANISAAIWKCAKRGPTPKKSRGSWPSISTPRPRKEPRKC